MPYRYVEQFRSQLEQKYARELTSGDLHANGATFIGTNTIKIPRITVGGYKEHSRSGGFNRQTIANDWETKVLQHDRDVEFFVDAMDVDETNQVLSAANITNTFEEEEAIPELDAYRYSKIYYEYDAFGEDINTTTLTDANVLTVFDEFMEEMDDAGVPQSGRILYVTAAVQTLLKTAQSVSRQIIVGGSFDGRINRAVRSLDSVKIVPVPRDRFKSKYVFTSGFTPDATARQINMMLVHPRSVIAVQKHSAINFFPPGSHTSGDGFLYQNRRYGDLFLIQRKLAGIKINADGAVQPNATLKTLTIGSSALAPTFAPSINAYTVSTTETKDKITATATDATNATVVIKVDGVTHTSGQDYTWTAASQLVSITVTNGTEKTLYLVSVETDFSS